MSFAAAQLGRDRERLSRVERLRDAGVPSVPELLAELIEPTWAVRRAVVAALAALGPPAIEPLCRALRSGRSNEALIAGVVDALVALQGEVEQPVLALTADENPAVVCDAAQILGRRTSLVAVPTLSALTSHPNDNVALCAIEALGRIGGRGAVDALLPLATSSNFFRAFPAIDALGRSGDPRAVPVLSGILGDALYGPEAIRALGRLGDSSAISVLIAQLPRANESAVRAIAVALSTIHQHLLQRFGSGAAVERAVQSAADASFVRRQLLESLTRADTSEQLALGRVLSWVGEQSTVPVLLALLDVPGAVGENAASSLKRLASSAELVLIEALREAPSLRRRLLLPILAGRRAARDAFVACLEDEDPVVRALACDALARTSDATPVSALFELLADDDLRVAQAALAAIQSLGSAETERLALAATEQADARVRCAALRIIGYFAYPAGLHGLLSAARDPDERVRVSALAALPLMEGADAFAAILRATTHSSARTRMAAVRALGQVPPSRATSDSLASALTDVDPWVRYYACQGLGRARDEAATRAISALLEDPSGQVRVASVEALAHLPGAQSFETLVRLMSSEDPDLCRAAIVGLGLSKRQEALAPLLRAAASSTPATRLVALSALAELGLPGTISALALAAQDPDPGVRTAAESFLASHPHPSAAKELVGLLAKDPSSESLVQALAQPGPAKVPALRAALESADDVLALALVAALSRMHTEAAQAAIRDALTAHNDAARRAAAAALVASGDPLAARQLEQAALGDADPEVRRICSAVLGGWC